MCAAKIIYKPCIFGKKKQKHILRFGLLVDRIMFESDEVVLKMHGNHILFRD